VLAVAGDGAGWAPDRRGALGERHYRAALQQPHQPGLFISAQPPVAWVWPGRDFVQPEQVADRPAERRSLLAPLGRKGLGVGYALLPAADLDQGGAALAEGGRGGSAGEWVRRLRRSAPV